MEPTPLEKGKIERVGPIQNQLWPRQVRQSKGMILGAPVALFLLLAVVVLATHRSTGLPLLIASGVGAVLVAELFFVLVTPRLTFQAKEIYADSDGLILRWEYLVGSRRGRLGWDKVNGAATEIGDHANLILKWVPLGRFASGFAGIRMDLPSYSTLKPILIEHGTKIRVKR
jgi:hypothetical protein